MAQEQASVVISAVDQATEVIKKVTGQFDGLQGSWGKLTTALGVGATATYLTTLVKDSIEAADRMGELSKITGVSVGTLSSLSLAAKTSGLDIEQVASILGKMNKNLAGVEEPGTSAAKGLGMLGINAEKFKDAKVEDRLFILADALEGVDNSTGDASRAMDLLVKGGSALIPMLDGGSEGLREMMATAEALGMTLDEATAASADRVADSFTILTQLGTGLGNKIMQQVLPTLEGLTATFLDAAKNSGLLESAAKGVVAVFNVIVTLGSVVWTTLKQVGGILGSVAAAVQLALGGDFKGAAETLKQGFADAGQAAEDSGKFIRDLWTNNLPKLTDAEIKTSKAIANRTGETKKGTEADKEAGKAAKAFADEQEKLIKKATEYIQTQSLELAGTAKLTDAQKQMLAIGEYMVRNYQELTEEELDYLRGLLLTIDANDAARQAQEASARSLKEATDAYIKAHDKAGELVAALEAEVVAMQYTGSEREIQIKLLELEKSGVDKTTAAYAEYEQRIREAVGTIQAQKASKEAADTSAKAWQKASDDIERALTDALVQGFGNGKSIVKSIGDWIVNYFKSTIAKGIAQALTGAIMGGISSIANAIGLGGSAGSAGGGVGDIGSMITSTIGDAISSALGLGGGLTGFGTGVMSGLGTFGSLAGFTEGASLVSAGFGAEGLGMLAGAAAPYVAAAAALYALISGFTTGRARGPAQQDYDVIYGNAGYTRGSNIYPTPNSAGPGGGGTNEYLRGIIDVAKEITKSLGGSFDESTGFGTLISASPDGLGAQVVGSVFDEVGKLIYNRNVNGGNDEVDNNLAAMTPGMILAALQESDFGEEINALFDRLNANTVTSAQLDAAIAQATEIKNKNDEAVDQATIDTADATQENTIILRDNSEVLGAMRDILDQLRAIAADGLAATASAASAAGNQVAGAVLALADRPIQVTVEVPEVNGGA